jgi:hypothetical protein|tara:strand:+ start:908 stop:2599 length:1692 start_codon:yes stop_codon:yes gene_type:complete
MARSKPIPRRVRRDLNSVAIRDDYNRGNEIRRDNDKVQNISNTIMDMDGAIMYYFNEVIKPNVVENKETIKVPVMYASPERWFSIQKQGFMRDKRQQLITPAIVFRRTGMERNENIPIDKMDANKPHNFQTFQQKYSQNNRYDQFSKTVGETPNKEYYNVVIPDYMILNYEFTIWTSYIEQMNAIVEKINYTDGAYWGEPGKMKFKSRIETFTDASELDAGERIVKTNFSVQLMGYIIPKEFNSLITTRKQLTPKKIIFNMDVEKSSAEISAVGPGGGVSISTPVQDIFSIAVSNGLTFQAGTGVTLSNNGATFDGSQAVAQTISIGQDVSTTSNVTFNQITAGSLIFGNPTVYSYTGISGSVNITGSLTTSGDMTVQGDTTILGTLTAKEFKTTYVSSSILFESGSTKLGDTIDDNHHRTGSVNITGSFSLNGYSINELSNDNTLGDQSTTTLVTEAALKAFSTSNIEDTQTYLRKQYYKSTTSILNTATASFTAVTASAPAGVTATDENDFLFFINGQYMEHDAITIQQSGSSFLLQVDTDGIGYELESDDEIISVGKFNS